MRIARDIADLQRLKRDTDSGRSAATRAVAAAQQSGASATQRSAITSRQLPMESTGRLPWKILIPAAVVVLGLVAGGIYWRSQKTAKLTDKDTIVIADFTNTTGDAVFDDTLKEALSIGLRQSPFLSILPEQRVNEILGQMGRGSDERLDKKTAREVCQRSQSEAVIEGSIASLGNEYILTLDAVNCRTGDSLAQEQVQAARKKMY